MIIRRRHTANFTTIGNVLFEDERLEADEVGVLAFLLSRPDDWEVRRPALARRWRIGRDSIKRIIFNCMCHGWIVARRTRLSNGTFHTIYEVRDQPGPVLTPEQVKAALSLVSSEVAPGGDDDEADPTPDYGGVPETGPPATPQPGAADQLRQTRRGSSKEELLNPDSINPESPNSGRVFADVKAAWPPEHVLSAFASETAFAGLKEAEQEPCFGGIKPYLADCKLNNRKVCDLTTYIRERRWERFSEQQRTSAGKLWETKPGTPQWYRWRGYNKVAEPNTFRLMESWATQSRSWWAPTEWPPPLPADERVKDEISMT